jgi:transposase
MFPASISPYPPAFVSYVAERLAAAEPEQIPASVLLRELRERGDPGEDTMLTALVTALKPKEASPPVVRVETGPGGPMQGSTGRSFGRSNRLAVFVAALGWSRASYVEFVTDERVETLIEAHANAFVAFGGTPSGLACRARRPRVSVSRIWREAASDPFRRRRAGQRLRSPQDCRDWRSSHVTPGRALLPKPGPSSW